LFHGKPTRKGLAVSDTYPESTAGTPLSPEQQVFLAAQAAQKAAAEAAGVTQAAADTASQMTERGPLLPAEEKIDALMAQLKAQSDLISSLQSQVGTVQLQMEQAQAATGGPLAVRYAQGAAEKIAALAVQWPAHDLAVAADAAGKLVETATAAAKGTVRPGDPSAHAALTAAAGAIRRVLGRLPHVDTSAIIDDVELAAEEGVRLLAGV
jgi:hypothetical protein